MLEMLATSAGAGRDGCAVAVADLQWRSSSGMSRAGLRKFIAAQAACAHAAISSKRPAAAGAACRSGKVVQNALPKPLKPASWGVVASRASSSRMRERATRLGCGSTTGYAAASVFSACNCCRSSRHSVQPVKMPIELVNAVHRRARRKPPARCVHVQVRNSWSLRPSSLVEAAAAESGPKDAATQGLAEARQLTSQLFCRSEERIFGGFFGRIQHFSDGAQAETLVMLQFKNHALARGKLAQRSLNPFSQHLAIQLRSGFENDRLSETDASRSISSPE